jgi:hypothetical protein
MQELYNQKMKFKDGIKTSESKFNELKSFDYPLNTDQHKYFLNTMSAYENKPSIIKFSDETSSEKPPQASFKHSSTVAFEKENHLENTDKLFDTEKLVDSFLNDFKAIEHMWDNFSIDNHDENRKSADFNKKFVKKMKKTSANSIRQRPLGDQYEWAPRVTIPKPFSMMIREKIKSDKKKQKAIKEMQQDRDRKTDEELKECNRKFTANPVPVHVQLPLYGKILLENELRKHKLKRMSQEYMKKVVKPFNLSKSKNLKRSNSYAGELNQFESKQSNLEQQSNRQEHQQRASSVKNELRKFEFAAKPLPSFYYEDDHHKNEK